MRRLVVLTALCLTVALTSPGFVSAAAAQSANVDDNAEGIETALAREGCFTIEPVTPWTNGRTAYAAAYWSCNTGPITVSIVVKLQQYRGLGVWRTKATSVTGVSAPFSRRFFRAGWTCAAGTGSQLYRTQTYAAVGAGTTRYYYSSQRRFTCP
jgi:hypothetical protein